jgi:hypothetical protein
MAKKKATAPVAQDEFEAELQSKTITLEAFNPDTPLVGIAKTEKGFLLLKVMVDSKTLETGEVEVIDTAENKWEANEKFKINVVKTGIL